MWDAGNMMGTKVDKIEMGESGQVNWAWRGWGQGRVAHAKALRQPEEHREACVAEA